MFATFHYIEYKYIILFFKEKLRGKNAFGIQKLFTSLNK